MATDQARPHPGLHIRKEIIPVGMSVSRAAEQLGVSRPTLSNLLNGKAALSAEMAARLERAFGAPRASLLQMQAAFDQQAGVPVDLPTKAIAYVPPFLAIRANHISTWASKWNLEARNRLAVLLRMLVNSTTSGLIRVDFPGNDDAERPGWDGEAEATEGSPWVPAGKSGWEFGCTANCQTKANEDYAKSVKAHSRSVRRNTTFVFVTPHRWADKNKWTAIKRGSEEWKDVRVYDASDLEQWIEQSLPAQAWFADEISLPSDVRSLDRCWRDWAEVAMPPLPAALFQPALDAACHVLAARLTQADPEATVIVADSIEEGLAFVAQAMGPLGDPRLAVLRDQVVVFDAPGALRKLADSSRPFIPVIHSTTVESELAPHAKKFRPVLIYPRNAHIEPHIVLEPIGYDALLQALTVNGKTPDEVDALARASGRSLTVLRRQLTDSPGIRRPEWAANADLAKQLVPLMLVGAWNNANAVDTQALADLAGCTTEEIEERCQHLVQLNDAPVWIADTYRGVVSKLDALFAVAGSVTREMLQRYFALARRVLGEDDPALDLAEEERAFANVYGKIRMFSKAFRDGISETLVLLSLHAHLFKPRGLNPEADAHSLFDALFPAPLTTRMLQACNADLPTYAEAVPERFLDLIEEDLKRPEPAVLGLLKPVDPSIFGAGPSRTGLLWALEGLAWNPKYLPRVVPILARLSEIEIADNWVNKPENSLRGIFRSWMPQTEAPSDKRVTLIKRLKARFPQVAWTLCLAQIGREHMSASPSHKPRWRGDGYGHGRPAETWDLVIDFEAQMLELALTWGGFTASQISDLIGKIPNVDEACQTRIWTIIETWGRNDASEPDKGRIVERIRVTTHTHRAARRAREKPALAKLRAQAAAAISALTPTDPLHKSMWLFTNAWIQESADEMDEDIDSANFAERDAHIQQQRLNALREIVDARGTEGLLELAIQGKTPWLVGLLTKSILEDTASLADLLRNALARAKKNESESESLHQFVGGTLRASWVGEEHNGLVELVLAELSSSDAVQVLLLLPFERRTWALADALGAEAAQLYWAETVPQPILRSDEQGHDGARRLLAANRPRAAFAYIQYDLASADPQFLANLLQAMVGSDDETQYGLERHWIEDAFKHIGGSAAITFEEKALLEFRYIEALVGHGERDRDPGIPHLERYIEAHPELFVQMVAWQYKRADGGQDPKGLQVEQADVSQLARRAHRLLRALRRIPGHDESGELLAERLSKWTSEVRSACEELGRLESADYEIGTLLAHAPKDPNGTWPCRAVRDVLEDLQSRTIMRGTSIGKHNARGAHWRDEGGNQERQLADQYRQWATAVEATHPYVASELLLALVADYEHQAEREDRTASVRRRLSRHL